MANIRIKDLATTATATSSDDYFAIDGTSSNTRKISAYTPVFGGGATVNGLLGLQKDGAYTSTIEGAQTASATGNSFLFKNSGAVTLLTLAYDGTATFAGPTTVNSTGTDSYISAGSGMGIYFRINGTDNALKLQSIGATFFNPVLASNGSAVAPSISFASDTDTGLYSDAANTLGIATDGVGTVLFSSSVGIGKIKAHGARVLALEAGTGNTNITLTPSGTGVVNLIGNNVSPLLLTKGSGAGGIVFSFNGTQYLSTITTSESGATANNYMDFGVSTGANTTTQFVMRLIGNGRALVGTQVDSGALLQVGTNLTTTANGMVFGTDVSLYRAGAASLALTGTGNPGFYIQSSGGANQFRVLYNAGSAIHVESMTTLPLKFMINSAEALLLDSALKATFAGAVTVGGAIKLANAYVATPVVSTGYVTIQDSTGTTYKIAVSL